MPQIPRRGSRRAADSGRSRAGPRRLPPERPSSSPATAPGRGQPSALRLFGENPSSRGVASGTCSAGRLDPGVLWFGYRVLCGRSGFVAHRLPARAGESPAHDGVRLACPRLRPVSWASWAMPFRPLWLGPRGKGRGRELPSGRADRARSPGRWAGAVESRAPAPQAKPSSPGLSPRGTGRAVGGIRAWAENPGRRASS